MRKLISLLIPALLLTTESLLAQTTYLPEGNKAYPLLERLEIKQGKNSNLNFSSTKPFSRRSAVQEARYADSLYRMGELPLTEVDRYNIQSLYLNNMEWVPEPDASFESKHPVWNTFYKTPAHLFYVNEKDFFLAIDPVLSFQYGSGAGEEDALYYNKRGITLRGRIANKIGFSTTITDNQERGPLFFRDYVTTHRAVPGMGFYKPFKKNGYDYFDGRGSFTFNVTKYIDVQFGYDKNFIGNGERSLFLDNTGNSALFLKLNTKIWKLNYQNLFMELVPTFVKHGDHLLDRKYAAMHHLSMNVTPWLNIGLFEGVVFGRKNRFDFMYLNPIIFLRHVEGTVGSPDNALAGIDFKANAMKQFQFYGQLLLDEFLLKEIFKNNGFWANKYGYQLGVKYIDAFNIKNLDLQVEANRVRPFTYSHYDSVANYTHYNQPLAHQLEANFQEFIGKVRYQPSPKWHFDAAILYYYKGLDTANANFGGDIFKLYSTRTKNYDNFVGGGDRIQVLNAAATLGYELKENLMIEANVLFRKESATDPATFYNIGIRLNAPKRNYNF